MNPKLKPVLVALGILSVLLLVSQLTMGLLIVGGGYGFNVTKLIKSHQHSGYATVGVSLIYVIFSVATLIAIPSRPKADAPVNPRS